MEFVTVFTSPEGVFGDDLLSAVRATQIKNLIVIEDDLNVATDFEKLSLIGWSNAGVGCIPLLFKKLLNKFEIVFSITTGVTIGLAITVLVCLTKRHTSSN